MAKPIHHITLLIYGHPELYPPTLSAIEELSKVTDKIDVITRNMLLSKWTYPENVQLHYINKEQFIGFEIETIPLLKKASHFITFLKMARKLVIANRSNILLVYDAIPLYAASLLRNTLNNSNTKLWYHNHDITDLKNAGRFSLMSMSAKREAKAIKNVDFFSLPAKERLVHFKNLPILLTPMVIPNYPYKAFYSKHQKTGWLERDRIKLLYQGSIGGGHGLEEIIESLPETIGGKILELHLVGKIRAGYLEDLQKKAELEGVSTQLFYHGMKAFAELPEFLSQFDIGLAVHKPYNITYATGGSASNKIYEYAALSMPVILYDNDHYRDYLGHNDWAFFTDLSKESLIGVFEGIYHHYSTLSKSAYNDFETVFNFETVFKPMVHKLLEN